MALLAHWCRDPDPDERVVSLVPELRGNSYQAMQAILRKLSPGVMTAAIYTGILLFALLCTFGGR